MKACVQCLFTEVDYPSIQIDAVGICDICHINEQRIQEINRKKSKANLEAFIEKIKLSKNGKYDCLIGISGGTDSSYLVYLAKKWGLSPLLMHVDGGWNSETSVINIERIVENSGFDFVTEVLPWHEMRDVQRAFIKANVIDIDLPFDNSMLKYNYNVAKRYNIKYVLNGYSTATEGIMPPNFTFYKFDKRNIYDINRRYGLSKIKKLDFISSLEYLYYDKVLKIRFEHPLNLIEYNKEEAKNVIKKEFDWKDYGGKHYENVFTRFYQGHILPKKFNVDKRKSHLSMLICSKQITRQEASNTLQNETPYPSALLERDDELFFCKKLNLSKIEFSDYMNSPEVSHRAFKSDLDMYDFFRPVYRFIKKIVGFKTFRV
jgi:N-acetyl sugar amidotransferase